MRTTQISLWTLAGGSAIGGLVVGLLIARAFAPSGESLHDATTSLPMAAPQARAAANCAQAEFATLTADVRKSVREEIAAFEKSFRESQAHSPNDASIHRPAPEPRVDDAAVVAAATRARMVLDAAIVRRQWTDHDADSLRVEFVNLPTEHRAEIVRILAMEINQGRLIPESDRMPF